MFEGFQRFRVDTGEAVISAVHGGTGPPVLLLHGFPESSAMWAGIAPALAATHTVVAADLRGYGESSRPESGPDHPPAVTPRAWSRLSLRAFWGRGRRARAAARG